MSSITGLVNRIIDETLFDTPEPILTAYDLLLEAINVEDIDNVKLALRHDIDLEKKVFGLTPLMQATKRACTGIRSEEDFRSQLTIMEILLEAGSNPNTTDDQLTTPLIEASETGCFEAVSLLLKQRDIDLNAQDESGVTALIAACEVPSVKIVKKLVIAGADQSITDDNGDTALNIVERLENAELRVALTETLLSIP